MVMRAFVCCGTQDANDSIHSKAGSIPEGQAMDFRGDSAAAHKV